MVTASAAALLIAATSCHRMLYRRRAKWSSSRSPTARAAGLGCVAVSTVGVGLLVRDVLVASLAMVIAASAAGLACALAWFVLPALRRRQLADLAPNVTRADAPGAAEATARR